MKLNVYDTFAINSAKYFFLNEDLPSYLILVSDTDRCVCVLRFHTYTVSFTVSHVALRSLLEPHVKQKHTEWQLSKE